MKSWPRAKQPLYKRTQRGSVNLLSVYSAEIKIINAKANARIVVLLPEREDDVLAVARYIVANPIRAGLVRSVRGQLEKLAASKAAAV